MNIFPVFLILLIGFFSILILATTTVLSWIVIRKHRINRQLCKWGEVTPRAKEIIKTIISEQSGNNTQRSSILNKQLFFNKLLRALEKDNFRLQVIYKRNQLLLYDEYISGVITTNAQILQTPPRKPTDTTSQKPPLIIEEQTIPRWDMPSPDTDIIH